MSTTALLLTAAGSLGVPAAAAPYPPTTPCALSWSQDAGRGPVLVGSGYETNTPVAVTVYPQARTLGYYGTNAAGAFEASVPVPHGDASWVTATSVHRSCSVVPPPPGASTPPPDGGSTAPPGSTPSSGSTGSGSTGSGGSTGGSGGSAGNGGSTGSGTGSGSGNGGSGDGGGTPYPPSTSSASPAPGSGSGSSAPSSTSPTRPGSTSSTPPRADTRNPATLGLPLSVILTIAALLLLAGGLGVLFLTRRAS